jgi:hypothetical protein
VAVHKRSDGRFSFLDPNYGIFQYDSARGVLAALVYLFVGSKGEAIYAEDEGNVTGMASHIVFGRAA